jgi:hypothetical protein
MALRCYLGRGVDFHCGAFYIIELGLQLVARGLGSL